MTQLSIEKISPKQAKAYLEENCKNRRMRRGLVTRYANEMREGNWMDGSATIKFDTNGNLIDGQHRLAAVIESGRTVKFDVRRGLKPDTFQVLDTGARRSPSDILSIAGYSYSSGVSAAIRVALSILEVESGQDDRKNLGKRHLPPSTLLEWAEKYTSGLTEAATMTYTKEAKVICRPTSVFTAMHFLFSRSSPRAAAEFFEILVSGMGFEMGAQDPIYRLREKLIAMNADNKVRTEKWVVIGLVIKAWNAFMERRPIGRLTMSSTESWPKINRRRSRVSPAVAEKRAAKRAAKQAK